MDINLRVAKPFQTLDELYNGLEDLKPWPTIIKLRESTDYVYTTNEMNDKGKIVKLSKLDRDQNPRTIICHDMKGGYLHDKFIDGSSAHDSYLFYHWSVVDIFIYFSHHMVTIPPYGWINTAHNHGVKVLGTVITERTDGERIWERVLSSVEETKRFANALILLAKFYNFEGWLLNIENKIAPNNIERLLYFIKYLTVGIHNQIQASEIIWYDSVTVEGDLKWQNELNNKNICFLKNCDGIFLNYNWTNAGLENSKKIASNIGKVKNIYVGLDVWGRGCPGGGGFNSIEALKEIRKHTLSVAIFGPAWTHEFFNGEKFQKIENIFWAQLCPLMYIHVPIYDNENFITTFCRGSGKNYYQNGICSHANMSFYNLSWQQIQISVPAIHLIFTSHNNNNNNNNNNKIKGNNEYIYETVFDSLSIRGNTVNLQKKNQRNPHDIHHIDFNDAISYNGGGCLELVSSNNHNQSYHRLFLIHFEFDSDIHVIIIYQKHDDSAADIHNNTAISNAPILILINNELDKHLIPYKNFLLKDKWHQSCYHVENMRTINEIGMIFTQDGRYYIGKIQMHPMFPHDP